MFKGPSSIRAPRNVAIALAVFLCAVSVAACGSSSSGSSSGSSSSGSTGSSPASTESGGASDAILKEAEETLAAGYKGDYQPPPTSGPKAMTEKTVWYISCGQAFEACVVQSNGFKEAARALGWKLTIQDGKADPTTAAALIRQAVAAKVDAVAIAYFDCPGIKSALLEAKNANIPVVALGGLDCNNPVFGNNEPALFAASTKLRGSTDPAKWYEEWARASADYVIAKTEGKGKVVEISEDSQAIQQANGKAFAEQIEKCSECELTRSEFSFSQVPNPATQEWKSALLSNPTYNVVANRIDALMFLGLETAVSSAGRPLEVEGAELNPGNVELIRNGTQASAAAVPYEWFTWATADTVNRVLAGESPSKFPNEGTGWQFVDSEHNLPAEGEEYEPPLDYKAAYEKIWKGE